MTVIVLLHRYVIILQFLLPVRKVNHIWSQTEIQTLTRLIGASHFNSCLKVEKYKCSSCGDVSEGEYDVQDQQGILS